MGVPKFFRWCAERYPTVITPFKDSPPPVDNLYLDINGIIHNCTHPNDIDATHRAPTEKEMIQAMFTYLEKLFSAIQPRKHFLLAVDGVAPRAKMNQQRQRRYRAGYEMMVAREEAMKNGHDVPDEKDVFDSNCITPGTPFMVRVSKEFQYFITMKLTTDPAWQTCEVIFSGHDCPGEGEHKIVDFIRRRKMQAGYNPNETHCMYGLDADLVMLALATHEPHFVLLREVVSFGAASRKDRLRQEEDEAKGLVVDKSYHKADEFVLFHINVLRDCLQLDVRERLSKLGAPLTFDLELVVDDFTFMCFFIGNDFLPSIPTVGINDGSMLTMLQLYVDHILSRGLFLTDKGKINWRPVELWLAQLGALEYATIKTRQQEEADYQRRRARFDPSHEVPASINTPMISIEEYKQKFYSDKHHFRDGWSPTSTDMERLKLHFLEGLSWVMQYYYQGVPSWQWYYPHYYAPMASDLVNLPAIAAQVRFDVGKPFLPHQQLLAVLPPMSYRSIPSAYWPLLRSQSSPLAKYFPEHIVIDLEGARAPWEGIVLIPFIDEGTLLAAYKSVQKDVSPEDALNNRLGPALKFSFDSKMPPYTVADDMFDALTGVLVRKDPYTFPAITSFQPVLCPGVATGNCQLEGFSTLQSKHSMLSTQYEVGAVSIFGMPSRKESMLLVLQNFSHAKTVDDAVALVGKEVLVGFPHYKRARIATISDARTSLTAVYTKDGALCGTERKSKNRDEMETFLREAETHQRYMKAKLGIVVEHIGILVYVHHFSGMRVTRKGRLVRQFASTETCYPLSLICLTEDIEMVEDARYQERDRSLADVASGVKCVYVGPEPKNKKADVAVYGSCGTVVSTEPSSDHFTISLKLKTAPFEVPAALTSFASPSNWIALHVAADSLGISARTLTTVCSSLVTTPQYGSREIGLCIKFTGRSLARVGYAKLVQTRQNPWYLGNVDIFARMQQDGEGMGHHLEKVEKGDFVGKSSINCAGVGTWYLSKEAVVLIADYINYFSPLVELIELGVVNSSNVEPQMFLTGKWTDVEANDALDELESFIEDSGILKVPMFSATEDVFPHEHLTELESSLEALPASPARDVTLRQVAKAHLYFPVIRSSNGHLVPIPLPHEQTFRLGSRVVNCRATGTTPFGASGTVVRLLASGREAEVVYDVPFTGGTRLDGRLKECRGAITKLAAMLVLKTAADAAAAASPVSVDVISLLGDRTSPKPLGHITSCNGSASKSTAANLVPLPRSALESTTTTLPGVVKVTSTKLFGGIKVADIIGQMSGAASPISPNPTAGEGSIGTAAGKGSVHASAAPSLSIPAPKSQQQKPFSRRNRAIPEEFMSGKVQVRPTDTAMLFSKWLDTFMANELKKLSEAK